jgi:hypothetical protein
MTHGFQMQPWNTKILLSIPAVWLAPQGDFVGDYQDSPLLLPVNRYALQLQGILRGPNLCESPLDSCAAGEPSCLPWVLTWANPIRNKGPKMWTEAQLDSKTDMCERIWAHGQCNNGCLHGEHRKVKPIQTSTEHVKFPAERRPQKYQKSVPNALGTKLVSEIHIKQSFWTLVSTSCDLMLTQQPAQVLPEQCLDAFLLKNPRAIVGWNTHTQAVCEANLFAMPSPTQRYSCEC